MKKELIIDPTEGLEFCEWLEKKGYVLRVAVIAPRGTGRKSELTSVELDDLWKEFDLECF